MALKQQMAKPTLYQSYGNAMPALCQYAPNLHLTCTREGISGLLNFQYKSHANLLLFEHLQPLIQNHSK